MSNTIDPYMKRLYDVFRVEYKWPLRNLRTWLLNTIYRDKGKKIKYNMFLFITENNAKGGS